MLVSIHGNCSIASGNPKIIIMSRHDFLNPKTIDLKEGEFVLDVDLNLYEIDQLRVYFTDKVHSENINKDTWVEITNIIVDEINLQHFIFKGRQYPRYDLNFMKQFNLPKYFCPGTKLYLNGVFEFDIELPIWKFLMENHKNASIS